MNDNEVYVFDGVYNLICVSEDQTKPPKVPVGNFRNEELPVFESFPACTLIRMDSVPDWRRRSTSATEDYTVDTYELNVYALTIDECKEIANTVSDWMDTHNFHRLSMRRVLNGNDVRVKRITARYEHRTDANGVSYR